MMKKRILSFNFRNTYLRQYYLSALLPLIGLSLILSAYYSRKAFDFNDSLYDSMLDTAANAMSASLSELEQISFSPYLYTEVANMVSLMHNGYCRPDVTAPDYLKVTSNESAYTMLLTKMLHSSQQRIQSITFYPLGDYCGDAYSINRSTAGLQYSQAPSEMVEELFNVTSPYEMKPVFLKLEDTPENVFSLLRTIRDIDSHRNLGVLRIDTRKERLTEYLQTLEVSENSGLLLLDSDCNRIYVSGRDDSARVDAALSGKSDIAYHFYIRELQAPGWHLVFLSSDWDIRSGFIGSILIICAFVILAFVLAFVLWRMKADVTIASVESILEGIRQLRHGNFDHVCTVADEEGYQMIADSLNSTGRRLHDLIEAEAEARECQIKAEYLALQSQINPHFLYNTLNGFIALNRMGEKQQLETSIIQLTKMFRYICNDNDTATLAQEYQFAKQYLDLQKLRFGDRVEYSVTFDENAADQTIPKLIIQPIVENCIVHGMEDSSDDILITLSAFIDEANTLVMQITDTGIGFDPDDTACAPHVGLQNVMRRLEMFSKGAEYQATSAYGCGTTVRIVLPTSMQNDRENKP